MSTDALFQLGIVPGSLNTTQTEDFTAARATGAPDHHPRARHLRALPAASSYPPTPR
ncbi:hypothetical protein [Pseudorhodoferax sp.]|uniref:hypothetical protein n=1 Tax=Pseudorhodoferax sp. TaxID=1993553 RepID=UPI0039E43C8A